MARKPWRWAGSRYGEGTRKTVKKQPDGKITTAERW